MQSQVFVGKPAPDFTAKAVMPDNSIESEFNLRHYIKGHRCILFFYPLNFTFVCPSEIIAFNNRLSEFDKRDTKVIAVSVDSQFSHLAWKNTEYNKGGIGNIQIPMVSDLNKEISQLYNVLNEDGVSLRGTFFIDSNFTTRHILVNDLSIGRNVDEALRVIDAYEYHLINGEVCPAGWQKGDKGIFQSRDGIGDYLTSHGHKL
ncbi:MAG: redoxin domain-containing protein [Rickettsiaceae bacterium]|nr:MAG: redoxin domain-containing protein [Rickettsiaceae bacterium]